MNSIYTGMCLLLCIRRKGDSVRKNQYEANEQVKLFRWSEFATGKYPCLSLLYHIPNGGSRDKQEAHNLKLQGVKPGVPDICLPVSCGKYHGLYIEMKYSKNKPTDNQNRWLKSLCRNGYCTAVCYSWEEARKVIENYLNGGINYAE